MSNFIFENTWEDNKKAMETRKIAVVPTGSTEQHGQALPVGTDWMIAEYFARQVGNKSDKVVVAPVVPFGHALYHADFCGTMAVSQQTLFNYVKEVCENLVSYGCTHIVFINGHGGNNNSLYNVGQYFRLKNIPVANIEWFSMAGALNKDWGLRGHCDIVETSLMMYIHPELVKVDRAHMPANKKYGEIQSLDLNRGEFGGAPVYINFRTKDITDTGDCFEYGHAKDVDYSSNPKDSTAEFGKEIAEGMVDYITRFIDEFAKLEY